MVQSMIVHYMVDVILIAAYCAVAAGKLLLHDDVAIEAEIRAKQRRSSR